MHSFKAGDDFMKRAFKCPTSMYNYKAIIRLEKHSPNAKFVVGVRHPVKMMQSFYNYRVAENYQKGLNGTEPIPSFLDLMEDPLSEPWKGVSMQSVRFELFLQSLGKTAMTPEDFANLVALTDAGYELAIKPNNFTIFLYTVDQLEDEDETRSAILLQELQSFLGLSTPLLPFGHENKNHIALEASAPPETIDICEAQYAEIRRVLLENGIQTAQWLREKFLHSPDVFVSQNNHFISTLADWGMDPCDVPALDEPVNLGVADSQI